MNDRQTEASNTSATASSETRRKRRLVRIGLRTLLVLLTITCAGLGCLAWRFNRARNQQKVVGAVWTAQGFASYDYQWDGQLHEYVADAEPPGPAWLRDLAGIDFLADVVAVQLPHGLEDVSQLGELKGLRELDLNHYRLDDVRQLSGLTSLRRLKLVAGGDLTPLASLAHLQWLDISLSEAVSDLSPLARLASLEELNLAQTSVSDLSPLAKLGSLRVLDISYTQVRDLSPLANLSALAQVTLQDVDVSEESIEELQKSLPECQLVYWHGDRR